MSVEESMSVEERIDFIAETYEVRREFVVQMLNKIKEHPVIALKYDERVILNVLEDVVCFYVDNISDPVLRRETLKIALDKKIRYHYERELESNEDILTEYEDQTDVEREYQGWKTK